MKKHFPIWLLMSLLTFAVWFDGQPNGKTLKKNDGDMMIQPPIKKMTVSVPITATDEIVDAFALWVNS